MERTIQTSVDTKIRILFFGHRRYPNDHAALETVFTRLLPAAGHQTVWVMQPEAPQYAGQRVEWNGTSVYVTPQRSELRGIKRLSLTRHYIRTGAVALQEHSINIIQARTEIPEAFAAWWLARRYGKPFVFQYSFPTVYSKRIWMKQRRMHRLAKPLFWIESQIERFLMRQATLVLAISRNMADLLRASGIDPVVTFPLGADLSVEPSQITPIAMPTQTIIYFGSMNPKRKLAFLLDAFVLVRQAMPEARLLMLGDASEDNLEVYAQEIGLADAITFVSHVPRREVPCYIRAARCSVAPIPPDPMYTLSSPTKVVESLGMAVPVVANREVHDQRDLVEASGGGYAPPYDRVAFAEAIVKLLRDPKDAARRGALGRAYIVEHRSYKVLSRQLIADYERYVLS